MVSVELEPRAEEGPGQRHVGSESWLCHRPQLLAVTAPRSWPWPSIPLLDATLHPLAAPFHPPSQACPARGGPGLISIEILPAHSAQCSWTEVGCRAPGHGPVGAATLAAAARRSQGCQEAESNTNPALLHSWGQRD